MIKKIEEVNFPSYLTLATADISMKNMEERTITTQVNIDGNVKPNFTDENGYPLAVRFMGEKYVLKNLEPQASKSNDKMPSVIDLTFYHWAELELKRYFFIDMPVTETGTTKYDRYESSMSLRFVDFFDAFNNVLTHYFDGKIVAEKPEDRIFDDEVVFIKISHTKIWDLLKDVYKTYGVQWQIVTEDEVCKIKFGFPQNDIDHIFEYGFQGGLLKVERQVQSDDIFNVIIGRGGDKNLPYRYFKNKDPQNPSFVADPDWIPELANMYFDGLRDAAFRSYVQGWKAKRYGGTVTQSQAYVEWAYIKGYTDDKFDPVEYVADEIVVTPADGDRRVSITPSYSPYVAKGSSLDKYGALWGGLEADEDIYPTIQGLIIPDIGRVDEVVDVEEIEEDEDDEEKEYKQPELIGTLAYSNKDNYTRPYSIRPYQTAKFTTKSEKITIPENYIGNVSHSDIRMQPKYYYRNVSYDASQWIVVKSIRPIYYNENEYSNIEKPSALGLTQGTYEIAFEVEFENTYSEVVFMFSFQIDGVKVEFAEEELPTYRTFDIWIKNIWRTSKGIGETDNEYVERVWNPILGNREEQEAAVSFSTGWLANEDYSFKLLKSTLDAVHYDTSKSLNGVQSHWRLTLIKSDAEYDAQGIFIPNYMINASAGDYFFFTGIDVPYLYYTEAEKRLTDYKNEYKDTVKKINPTWVVSLSKTRVGTKLTGEDVALIEQIRPGVKFKLADKRFIDGEPEELYISSVTYSYKEPKKDDPYIIPDVEIVLSDSIETGESAASEMRGDIESVKQQVSGFSMFINNIDKRFLRKDTNDSTRYRLSVGGLNVGGKADVTGGLNVGGKADVTGEITAYSGAVFGEEKAKIDENGNSELLTAVVRAFLSSPNFVDGFTGEGWKLWMEESLSHLTIDKLTVRQVMTVFELLIQKIRSVGGQIIVSSANGKIKKATKNDNFWQIEFEQENTFQQHDLMRCATWKNGSEQHSYWVEIYTATTSMVLVESSEFNGVEPEIGDECVLMGNTDVESRQNLISISATEDGKPRIDVLDGVKSKSFEGCLRTRLGNLYGINDSFFPIDNQPHGNGLYADNAYLRGTFLLTTGEDIKTKFEVIEGKIQSSIEAVRNDLAPDKSFLYNSSFEEGLYKWDADTDVTFFLVGNKWVWANDNIVGKNGDVGIVKSDGRTMLRIKGTAISQKAKNMSSKPQITTNSNNQKEPALVYLSFFYKVVSPGTLTVNFTDPEGEHGTELTDFGFINYDSMSEEVNLDVTDGYKQFTKSGFWNGKKDFNLAFTGEIYIYMLILSTDRIDSLTYKYRTLFEQSEKLVKIAATSFDNNGNPLVCSEIVTKSDMNSITTGIYNEDGTLKQGSGLVTKPDGAGLYAFDSNGALALVGTMIDKDGKSVVKLTGDKIIMEGDVTANGNFKIKEDGSIEANNAVINGNIVSTSGRFIGLTGSPYQKINVVSNGITYFDEKIGINLIVTGNPSGTGSIMFPVYTELDGVDVDIINATANDVNIFISVNTPHPPRFYYRNNIITSISLGGGCRHVQLKGFIKPDTDENYCSWLIMNTQDFYISSGDTAVSVNN